MCFGFSFFVLEFVIWIFPELCILRIGGRISDLCNIPFMVLASVGDSNSVDFFDSCTSVYCVFFLFMFVFLLDRFQLSVFSLTIIGILANCLDLVAVVFQ